MLFWKLSIDGYIHSIGTGEGETAITEEEYEEILAVIRSRPTPPDGYDYCLRDDLTWEEIECPVPPVSTDPIADLQAENATLKAQVAALTQSTQFLEDCLVEMAETVYA